MTLVIAALVSWVREQTNPTRTSILALGHRNLHRMYNPVSNRDVL